MDATGAWSPGLAGLRALSSRSTRTTRVGRTWSATCCGCSTSTAVSGELPDWEVDKIPPLLAYHLRRPRPRPAAGRRSRRRDLHSGRHLDVRCATATIVVGSLTFFAPVSRCTRTARVCAVSYVDAAAHRLGGAGDRRVLASTRAGSRPAAGRLRGVPPRAGAPLPSGLTSYQAVHRHRTCLQRRRMVSVTWSPTEISIICTADQAPAGGIVNAPGAACGSTGR